MTFSHVFCGITVTKRAISPCEFMFQQDLITSLLLLISGLNCFLTDGSASSPSEPQRFEALKILFAKPLRKYEKNIFTFTSLLLQV